MRFVSTSNGKGVSVLLTTCCEPGCETLVLIGGTCVGHDVGRSRVVANPRPVTAAVGRAETRTVFNAVGATGRAPRFDRRAFPSIAETTLIGR